MPPPTIIILGFAFIMGQEFVNRSFESIYYSSISYNSVRVFQLGWPVTVLWLETGNVGMPGIADPDFPVGMKASASDRRYSSMTCPVQQASISVATIRMRTIMIR